MLLLLRLCLDKRLEPWEEIQPHPLKILKDHGKCPGRIMFPIRHDITPANIDRVLTAVPKLLGEADNLLIVTKPHFDCIMQICSYLTCFAINPEALEILKKHVMFRFTIGSQDSRTLKFWEPGAPSYEERLASLVYAHHMGFQTSVSCEPALEGTQDYLGLVRTLSPFVTDAIWIGKMNHIEQRLKANNAPEWVLEMGRKTASWWTDQAVRDLYGMLKDNPKVKWKDSIKDVLRLERPTTPGADV